MIGYSSGIILSKLLATSGLRLGFTFIIALMIISSPIFILINPASAVASSFSTDSISSGPSTISQDGGTDFTTQAALSSVSAKQSNNIVNTRSYYDITFTTASGGSIKDIIIDFPSGTAIGTSGLLVEREGIGPGTATKTGPLQITYTVTSPVNIPPGTTIRLELSTIDNPPDPGASYKVTVTTKRPIGTTIDGPTQSIAYKIKAVEGEDVAESFMKKVTLFDNAAGNALGWNPNGVSVAFNIAEPAVSDAGTTLVAITVDSFGGIGCFISGYSSGSFFPTCENAPAEGSMLDYVVINLPAHVS